jgi:hypothetical protein
VLAERAGGGVWLACNVAPATTAIRLWNVGTATTRQTNTGVASDMLCLTPAAGGRLWAGAPRGTYPIVVTRSGSAKTVTVRVT